ncbi:biopolymer transporter ExbD [Dolichospermum sp. LEGE 00240]|jgi:biopolymer transport protein ExbD|uniref:ExbD/TolR family protein n=1 Tax=Dolichospermum sp. LEGE 00240 TaxID=1828603 RepID=UPI001882AB12|nr:biopolymer transporter ExbD [Dolichospermum sp. LEGE 00240]MDM3846187.1 biopolymer transporter ExbD [Aphanizomenon gracile PMC638.10]MDM3851095.1 biopolymer transporter ExbD [Aphanizomenon gracile PMC627.10]MDM3855884.1 biopolymer transporter ExbD [Aphanizomenon gracile PMC649.10]MDM3859726.1 biopolymer transporter ExbD [Aphanizomenon gracile PMC644.10]MBE9249340.1 biopolymer transporter ExbD [Dolichospermum sp. LEGE 00240]
MKVKLDTSGEDLQIQIISLIDVVFCILTFFLLAALQFTRQQAINVDLPKAGTGENSAANSQIKSKILPVTIDAIGLTYIEKEPVNREELEARLKQYIQTNPDGILVLNASRTATYNDVIQTLDLLRKVGGNRVSLGIIPGSSQPLTNSPNFPTPPISNNPTTPEINSPESLRSLPPINPNSFPTPGNRINPDTLPQAPVTPGTNNSSPQN